MLGPEDRGDRNGGRTRRHDHRRRIDRDAARWSKTRAGEYQALHKDAKISVSGGGSAVGINQVAVRAIDIGDSDITAPGHPELIDNRVAVVGFAVSPTRARA